MIACVKRLEFQIKRQIDAPLKMFQILKAHKQMNSSQEKRQLTPFEQQYASKYAKTFAPAAE